MPPSDPAALETALAGQPPVAARALRARLGISQPTLSRLVARLVARSGERVLRIGRARATRYALARAPAGLAARLPLYRVDAAGRIAAAGTLHPLSDGGSGREAPDGALAAYLWGVSVHRDWLDSMSTMSGALCKVLLRIDPSGLRRKLCVFCI